MGTITLETEETVTLTIMAEEQIEISVTIEAPLLLEIISTQEEIKIQLHPETLLLNQEIIHQEPKHLGKITTHQETTTTLALEVLLEVVLAEVVPVAAQAEVVLVVEEEAEEANLEYLHLTH